MRSEELIDACALRRAALMTLPTMAPPFAGIRANLYSALMRVRPAQLGDALKRLLGVKRTIVQTQSRLLFWIDPVSVLGQSLWKEGVYEPGLSRVVSLILRPGDTFVDVGANEGYFSVLAAVTTAGCVVHAVEPQRRCHSVLERNLALNGVDARVHKVALSSTDGVINLYLRPSSNTGASSMYKHWKFGSHTQTVPALTLDSLMQREKIERVRLLKLDCEGAEGEIIKGARNVLGTRSIDFVAVEFHPQICGLAVCASIHDTLTAYGYARLSLFGHVLYSRPDCEQELAACGLEPTDESVWLGQA